jgi:elongation factor Ts
MSISAALVKELRERTQAGMMECKKALEVAGGDIEKAIEDMRKAGQAKAVKKASRATAEGIIIVLVSDNAKQAVLVEVNCETDFVAREERFKQFAKMAGEKALQQKIQTLEALQTATEEMRLHLVGQLGENLSVRRLVYREITEGVIGAYAHGDANGVRIGTMVVMKKGSIELAKDLAMQVAAMSPEFLRSTDVPPERLAKEKEIMTAQALEQVQADGKPVEMVEKIVAGKLKKFSTESSLLGQAFVRDPAKTVEKLLAETASVVENFVRFEVGEGVQKKEDNFVEEVMAQVRGE